MYLGRVIGTVVCERKVEGLEGKRFLVVQPLSDTLEEVDSFQVAVDVVQAGPGDLVYLVGSREAALALDPYFVPVDAAIVGIVDGLHSPGRERAAIQNTKPNGAKNKAGKDRAKAPR